MACSEAATCGAFLSASRVVALVGAAGTGKTQGLVERVRALVEGGEDPAQVLVLAASAPAADELTARIAGACGRAADEVRVTTPLALARELLARPEAGEALGGRTHMLCGFENNFFLEDMRVTGVKQRRLREMLKFLQRGWSEMREDEEGWLITGEEVAINDFARSRLSLMGALAPAEVAAACVRYLRVDGEALAQVRRAHVIADDFRAMSRAAQRLACLLATQSVCVAWDTVGGLRGEEPYGYADGLDELVSAAAGTGAAFERHDLVASCLFQKPAQVVENLFGQDCLKGERLAGGTAEAAEETAVEAAAVEPLIAPAVDADAPAGVFEVLTAPDLNDEMGLLARTVHGLIEGTCPVDSAGCAEAADDTDRPEPVDPMAPGDIYIAAPTDAWARRAAAALESAGIPAALVEEHQILGGDIRNLDACAPAVAYTALHLAADPACATAWRAWCGFGDWLTCSAGFSVLADEAQESGSTLVDLLERLAGDDEAVTSIDARKIAARYRAGRAMLDSVRGLTGTALLEALCRAALPQAPSSGSGADPQVPASLLALLGSVGDAETPAELYARAERALLAPRFSAGCVRVGSCDTLLGLAPRAVVACGFVNGLVPPIEYFDLSLATIDEQDRLHRRLIERLIGMAGAAREVLVCTGFARAGIVESETLKLKTERVRLRDGRRVCDLGPSAAVAYLRGERTGLQR